MSEYLSIPPIDDAAPADGTGSTSFRDTVGNKSDDALTQGVSPSLFALSGGAHRIVSVATPDGSSTAWTSAAHRLFTVSGTAYVRIFGVVTESLTEGNGDEVMEAGVAGATAALIAQLADPNTLVAGDIFCNPSTSTAVPAGFPGDFAVVTGIDIDLKVTGTTGITNGAITFYCEWIPISAGATVVAAVWD